MRRAAPRTGLLDFIQRTAINQVKVIAYLLHGVAIPKPDARVYADNLLGFCLTSLTAAA
jgi:hypothetical protein